MIKSMERDTKTNKTKVTYITPTGEEKTMYVSLAVEGLGRVTPDLSRFGVNQDAMGRLFKHATSMWTRGHGYTKTPVWLGCRRLKKIMLIPEKSLRRLLKDAVKANVMKKKFREGNMKRPLYSVPLRYLR